MGGRVSSLFGQGSPPLKLLVVHALSHSVLSVLCTDATLHQDGQAARSVPWTGLLVRFFSQLDNIAMSSSGRHWFVFHVGCRQARSNSRLVLKGQCAY